MGCMGWGRRRLGLWRGSENKIHLKKYKKMALTSIHSFLVHPEKKVKEKSRVKGTIVPQNDNKLYETLRKIYNKSIAECKYDIAFLPTDDGEQKNECRDEIINYVNSSTFENGIKIAERLANVTSPISGLGLLFLMIGEYDKRKRIVISRFRADTGVLADEEGEGLLVEYVEKIFMKSASAYKCVCYEEESFGSNFWEGKAADKQINNGDEISSYWINDFLLSDFTTTSERGSKRFAEAMRSALNSSKIPNVKKELSALITLTKGHNDQIVSVESLISIFKVSTDSANAVKKAMKGKTFFEQFKLSIEEFEKHVSFKTIELDNGAILSAPTEKFDNIFSQTEMINDTFNFTVNGRIINEQYKESPKKSKLVDNGKSNT
jgi:hypothetical protein